MDISSEAQKPNNKFPITINPHTQEIVLPGELAIRSEPFQFVLDYLDVHRQQVRDRGFELEKLSIPQKKTLFQDLQKVDEKVNRPYSEYFAKGEEGIAEFRKTLNLPRNIPLDQVIALAESVIADKDEAIRETYEHIFQTGLVSSKIRQKMRVEHQMYPRDIDFLIHNQSPEQNRSIVEIVSNAIDFSKNGYDIEVTTRSDGYTVRDHGQGMTPVDMFEKLVVPFVSGTRSIDKATIGKFGMGFLTILDHLKNDGDTVNVRTSKSGVGYQFDYVFKDGSIFVNFSTQTDVTEGTEIGLKCAEFDKDSAEKVLHSHIRYKRGSKVVLNDQVVNKTEDYEKIEYQKNSLETAAILYKENKNIEKNENCQLRLLINGISIEEKELKGVNLPSEFIIDLPYTATLPESRNEVSFNSTVYDSLSSIIGQLKESLIDNHDKVQIINGLAHTVRLFASRSQTDTQMIDELFQKLSDSVADIKAQTGATMLPAVKGIQNIKKDQGYYVSDILEGVTLAEIPGIERVSDFKSDKYVLYVADFRDHPTVALIHKGSVIVLDRKAYEKHKDMPALLELYLELEVDAGVGVFSEKREGYSEVEKPFRYDLTIPESLKNYLTTYLFTPRVIGHNLLTALVIPDYDYYPKRNKSDQPKLNLSHESAMMICDYLAGKRDSIPFEELDFGVPVSEERSGNDEIDYLLDQHHMHKGDLLDKRDREMFDVFQEGSMNQLLALPYNQIEKTFTQMVLQEIGKYSGIKEFLMSSKHDQNRFEILRELVKSYGREAQEKSPTRIGSTRLNIFMRILESALPKVENYTGFMQAYEEELPRTPDLDKYLKLNFDSVKAGVVYTDVYRSVKGIAEIIRNLEDPKKVIDEMIIPLFNNPFVDREQVFSMLLASADVESVVLVDAYPDNPWPSMAFGGSKRDAYRRNIFEGDYNQEEQMIINTAKERQKDISAAMPVITENIVSVTNLPFVKQMANQSNAEIHRIFFYEKGGRRSSKKYYELLNIESMIKEPQRYQTKLSANHLQIIEKVLTDHFKVGSMSQEECEKALVFINRAIGIAHLDSEKFKFATDLMMHTFDSQHRRIGNFGEFAFSDKVIDILYSKRDCFRNKSIHQFLNVWEGLNLDEHYMLIDKSVDDGQILKLNRILDIWEKVAQKPKFFQDMLINDFSNQVPKGEYGAYYYFKHPEIPLSEVPTLIRPYIIYFHHGDESQLKIYEGKRLGDLPHSLHLSELALMKRLQNEDFHTLLKQPDDFAEWVGKASAEKDTFVAKRELMHAVNHLPASDPYLFLRELIQNSLDASMSEQERVAKLNIEVKDYREGGYYVVEITDQVGINFDTVFSDMLIAGETTKQEGGLGKFGIGFLSILNGAEMVEIATGNGVKTTSVKVTPVKNDRNEIIDYQTSYSVSDSEYKGTSIKKYSQDNKEILESALLHDAALRYGSFIDENKVEVLYRGEKINRAKKVLAQRNVPGFGNLEFIEGNDTVVLQGDLYVTQLPDYIKDMIPEPIRELVLKHGIILNIDSSIPLIRTRNDIAQKKKYLPLLEQTLPPLIIESLLVKYGQGHFDFTSIPYDYFWADGCPLQVDRVISEQSQRDADNLNKGVPITDYSRYNTKEALLELLTVINCVTINGRKMSLRDVAIMIDDGFDFEKVEVPQGIKNLIDDAIKRKKGLEDQKKTFDEQKKKQVQAFVPTESQIATMRASSDTHLAFLDLANRYTYPEIAQKIQHGFYYLPNGSAAFAVPESDFKGWNLLHLDHLLETLATIIKGEEGSNDSRKFFWKSFFEYNSHEDTHFTVGTQHWSGHHNDQFIDEQKKLINYLIYNTDLESAVTSLKQNYSGSRLPSGQLVDTLGMQSLN